MRSNLLISAILVTVTIALPSVTCGIDLTDEELSAAASQACEQNRKYEEGCKIRNSVCFYDPRRKPMHGSTYGPEDCFARQVVENCKFKYELIESGIPKPTSCIEFHKPIIKRHNEDGCNWCIKQIDIKPPGEKAHNNSSEAAR